MVHAGYGIGAVGLTLLLFGAWTLWRLSGWGSGRSSNGAVHGSSPTSSRHPDIEHQALVFLMTQKTDSVLAALADAIEQERHKLGVAGRRPMGRTLEPVQAGPVSDMGLERSVFDRIGPMADDGVPLSTIAQRLNLPESQVAMVMRLNGI